LPGMPGNAKKGVTFYENMRNTWWHLDENLDEESLKAAALLSAIKSVKSGTTMVFDHHSSPNFITGSLHIIKQAYEQIGISVLPSFEISNRLNNNQISEALDYTAQFGTHHKCLIGINASFTTDNEILSTAVQLMEKTDSGIHIHAAEDELDQQLCLRDYKVRVLKRLLDAGVLKTTKTILAHAVHLNDNEKSIFHNSVAYIAQCTESNMYKNVGLFNSEWLGDKIFMGTDGLHCNMLQAFKQTYLSGIATDNATLEKTYQKLRTIHQYTTDNLIPGDQLNNLMVFTFDQNTALLKNSYLEQLFFNMEACNIEHVIANGLPVLLNKKLVNCNENEIIDYCNTQMEKFHSKLKSK